MPGPRRTVRGRARGSALARLAGIGVIVVLAGGAVAGYLLTLNSAPRLPTRVISDQTVGLVAQSGQPGSSGQLVQLLGNRGTPQFSPVSQTLQQSGSGQWTADFMSGGTYIFIFLPTDDCLGATATPGRPKLALQHCDLQASQRWRRVGRGTLAQGHLFYQYANMSDRSCVTEGGKLPGQVWAASRSTCTTPAAASQLVAFWWDGG